MLNRSNLTELKNKLITLESRVNELISEQLHSFNLLANSGRNAKLSSIKQDLEQLNMECNTEIDQLTNKAEILESRVNELVSDQLKHRTKVLAKHHEERRVSSIGMFGESAAIARSQEENVHPVSTPGHTHG